MRATSARWWAIAAAIGVIVAMLAASAILSRKPPTVSVGDEALLEIYTLHAAHGALRVGAYSRFLWNHPGPSLFYLFAPGYLLSGYREDSLFATTLIANIAVFGALLWCLRKYGGSSVACAAAAWFVVLAFHPAGPPGWDFGDWLASSWNPHAPMLPLALLLALAAALGAGALRVLPALVGVASFVAQAHVGLAPISVAVVATSVTLYALAHVRRWQPRAGAGRAVPMWARALDGIAGLYGALLLWVLAVGGFDAHVAGVPVTVNSPMHLATTAAILMAVRHAGARAHPVLRTLADRLLRSRWIGSGGALPADARSTLAIATFVWLAFWSLPLIQQLSASGPGNLTQLFRFAGEGGGQAPGAGLAAFTYYLSGVMWRGLEVAAAGKTISSANLTWPAVLLALTQLTLLGVSLRRALSRGRSFHAALCVVCLVASAVALWSVQRIHGALYDHLAFWIVIVGAMNLTAITGAAAHEIWERRERIRRWCSPRLAVPVLLACVAAIALHGTRHLLAGHQQARYSAEAAEVSTLFDALGRTLHERGLERDHLLVDAAQDAWSVTAGLVLELYKGGTPPAVSSRWLPIYGQPLAPTGRETVEITVADPVLSQTLAADAAYQRIGRTATIDLYLRTLSRSDRVKLRSSGF